MKNKIKQFFSNMKDAEYISEHKGQFTLFTLAMFIVDFLIFIALYFVFGWIGAELHLLGGILH